MQVKLEWDLDPGSDIQSCFHLDHVLNTSCGDTEAEFYTNPGVSPTPLPNDDIWKKFDMNEELDEELDALLEDVASVTWMNPSYNTPVAKDAREIRNHDCMWAGTCVSEKHEGNGGKDAQKCINLLPVRKQPLKTEEVKVEGASPDRSRVCVKKNVVVAPTHARSLLLPTRIVTTSIGSTNTTTTSNAANAANRFCRSKTLDSGGESPRPETPQSLSDSEDLDFDFPDLKNAEDYVVETLGYNFVNEIVNNVHSDSSEDSNLDVFLDNSDSEISGCNMKNVSISPTKVTGQKLRTSVKQEVPISRHYTPNSFFSDHCYHLSKNARMDYLGVQTPSDSEEEIDVETVYGDSKKPNSRSSSSGGVLPTNPTLSDRQALQLTVASAISKKEVKRPSARSVSVPARYSLDERTLKTKNAGCKRKLSGRGEARRTGGGGKRSAQFYEDDFVTKSVKRKKYQYQRHFKSSKSKKCKARRSQMRNVGGGGGGSSDSEPDSSERRTVHNNMERQRRIDLRNSFEELRKLVPYTAGNQKAAKVTILSYGAQFCRNLETEESELTRKRAELRRQQEMLRAKVCMLRRSLAAQRRQHRPCT